MNNDQEVTINDVAKRLKALWKFLFSKWLVILIAGIIGGALGLIYALNAKPKYSATLNFVLSSNSSSGGGLMGLATQFGINLGGDNNDAFSEENIVTLMQSRRMVQEALFKKPGSINKSLINIFIEDNKLNEGWQQKERLRNAYPFPDSASKMSLVQDSLSRLIYDAVTTNLLNVTKPFKDQSIYAVTATSKNPVFSYYLTKYLVNTTSAFYIATKTSTATKNLNMLQHETDSLRNILGGVITLSGSQTDYTFNLNPAYQVQRSGAQESQARAAALGQAYGQALQSLEIAKITLQKEMPLYQIIDEPTLPLTAEKPGKLLSLIAGGLLGGFLICCMLIGRRVYKSLN